MSEARVKIAEALADADKDPCDFFGEDDSAYWLRLADAALAAHVQMLKDSRVVIVALPEPTMHSGAGDPVWQTLIGSESEDVYFEGDETVVSGTCHLFPDELVPLAAALLAADAVLAEAVEDER